jgi:hypothetical protein
MVNHFQSVLIVTLWLALIAISSLVFRALGGTSELLRNDESGRTSHSRLHGRILP